MQQTFHAQNNREQAAIYDVIHAIAIKEKPWRAPYCSSCIVLDSWLRSEWLNMPLFKGLAIV